MMIPMRIVKKKSNFNIRPKKDGEVWFEKKKNQARQNNLITVLPNSYSSNLVRCPIFAVSMVSLW